MPRSAGVKAKVERAAVDLFAANGFDGASIADIAAAAGVSQGALYRHYPSKEELAWSLFSAAYLRTGAELAEIRVRYRGFAARLAAMVEHFCVLYDRDAALFRFMLIAQHGFLPRIRPEQRTPVDAIADIVEAAVREGEAAPVDPLAATAAIMGIVLQTAFSKCLALWRAPLPPGARGLARAPPPAATALADPPPRAPAMPPADC